MRSVVATRAPQDFSPALRAQGLSGSTGGGASPQQRIVPAPARTVTPQTGPTGQNAGGGRSPGGDGTPNARGSRQGGAPGTGRQAATGGPQAPGAPPAPNVQGAPGGQQPAQRGEGRGTHGERTNREQGKGASKNERSER